MIKALIQGLLRSAGYEIQRVQNISNKVIHDIQVIHDIPSCEDRLRHAADLGFKPEVIYDCGAFIGKWAKQIHGMYPEAEFILIEPNHYLHDEIGKNIQSWRSGVRIVSAAVAQEAGQAELNIWENSKHRDKFTALAASSLLSHVQGKPSKKIQVEVKTIDSIIEETGKIPDLLKLDLQGAEKSALLGATMALRKAEMVIIEFGCLDAYENRTSPHDLFDILYQFDFRLYDIVDLQYRPFDDSLVGGDFFFVKKDSKLKEHKDYF